IRQLEQGIVDLFDGPGKREGARIIDLYAHLCGLFYLRHLGIVLQRIEFLFIELFRKQSVAAFEIEDAVELVDIAGTAGAIPAKIAEKMRIRQCRAVILEGVQLLEIRLVLKGEHAMDRKNLGIHIQLDMHPARAEDGLFIGAELRGIYYVLHQNSRVHFLQTLLLELFFSHILLQDIDHLAHIDVHGELAATIFINIQPLVNVETACKRKSKSSGQYPFE